MLHCCICNKQITTSVHLFQSQKPKGLVKMFPPMVSASPPPSDDEPSGDEGEELGVTNSSFDITGLSPASIYLCISISDCGILVCGSATTISALLVDCRCIVIKVILCCIFLSYIHIQM